MASNASSLAVWRFSTSAPRDRHNLPLRAATGTGLGSNHKGLLAADGSPILPNAYRKTRSRQRTPLVVENTGTLPKVRGRNSEDPTGPLAIAQPSPNLVWLEAELLSPTTEDPDPDQVRHPNHPQQRRGHLKYAEKQRTVKRALASSLKPSSVVFWWGFLGISEVSSRKRTSGS